MAGCSASDPQALPLAANGACAVALAAAPAMVADRPRTEISTASAVAWAEGNRIVVRCGLPELAPTSLPCVEVDGVDWVVDTGTDPMTAASFGRTPGLEVLMPASYGPPALAAALVDLRPMAQALPAGAHRCG